MRIQKLLIIHGLALVLFALVLGGCTRVSTKAQPKASEGLLDLSDVSLETDIIRLDGQWEFYWNQLLAPDALPSGTFSYVNLPSSWNQAIKDNKENQVGIEGGHGFATYRLTFVCKTSSRLAMKIPRLRTAQKIWVNGELEGTAGQVGTTRETMVPQYLPQIVFFDAMPGKNEIIVQVSNFHQRSGGMLESIQLGSEQQILKLRQLGIAKELFLFGSLFSLGVYHLALVFFQRKNHSSLYFGLFCIIVGIRTLLVGENFFTYVFPDFDWEIGYKIRTLIYYLGVPLIVMFFLSVFPTYFHRNVMKMSQVIGTIFALLVLLTPARIFTVVNPCYQLWSVLVIGYVCAVLIKISVSKESGSWLIVFGAFALLLASLHDIVYLSIWYNDSESALLKSLFGGTELSSLGQFIFAIANSLLLAKRFSESLKHEEIMGDQLRTINANLDALVLQRTKALEESTKKIQQQKFELVKTNRTLNFLSLNDPMTGLWNRRKYDRAMKIEWNRCLAHKTPLTLILIDIDHFKLFNDSYGHMAGDECLTKIARTLKHAISHATDMVVRYGGEEFVVLLAETGIAEAMQLAELLRQTVEMLCIPHAPGAHCDWVTISIGVTSIIPTDKLSYQEVFQMVDHALYQAKASGRNQVKYYSDLNEI